MKKPIVLTILDGYGLREEEHGNPQDVLCKDYRPSSGISLPSRSNHRQDTRMRRKELQGRPLCP